MVTLVTSGRLNASDWRRLGPARENSALMKPSVISGSVSSRMFSVTVRFAKVSSVRTNEGRSLSEKRVTFRRWDSGSTLVMSRERNSTVLRVGGRTRARTEMLVTTPPKAPTTRKFAVMRCTLRRHSSRTPLAGT
eukprot:Amastigsp_a845051_17.p2 type:complete len:135 gc:universal Amastigsp_a845051_17:644-240(-)